MALIAGDVARMIDCSMVRPQYGEAEIKTLAADARRHGFIGAHVLPCYVAELSALLRDAPDVLVGTGAGFPSGGHTTAVKVREAERAFKDGCHELDMVINVGALRSGRCGYVEDEIKAVVDVAAGKTVKVILEVHYLTDDDIKRACELCISGGAQFVKTSTGWAPTGATPENVALIRSCVGDAIQIKAAGGVRDIAALEELHKLGATRFGIGHDSALKIMEECRA